MTHLQPVRSYLLLPVLLFLFTVTVSSCSSDYQDGVDAYNRKDYQTALNKWQPLAEQGDAKAQYKLGLMYGDGQGVSKDKVVASMYFTLAIDPEGFATKARYKIEKNMTSAQITEARELARDWMEKYSSNLD